MTDTRSTPESELADRLSARGPVPAHFIPAGLLIGITEGERELIVSALRAPRSERTAIPAELVLVSRSFLEATPCPNKQCSGGMITSTGPDPEHEPCQWCEAKDRMLNGEVPLL